MSLNVRMLFKAMLIVTLSVGPVLVIANLSVGWWLTNYIAAHGWLFFISQVAITLVGVPAIYISQSLDPKVSRWASVLGLIGQPFWYMMAYATTGWGVFIMSLFYTAAWLRGFINHWIRHPNLKPIDTFLSTLANIDTATLTKNAYRYK